MTKKTDLDLIDKPNASFSIRYEPGDGTFFILKISDRSRRYVRFKLTDNQVHLIAQDAINAIQSERGQRWRTAPLPAKD